MVITYAQPRPTSADTWEALAREVRESDGALDVEMRRLRDIYGAGRNGSNVRAEITRELAGHGLGHLPAELPPNQEQHVVLYNLGTAAAEVITALTRPPSGHVATAMRRLNSSRAEDQVERIRSILAED